MNFLNYKLSGGPPFIQVNTVLQWNRSCTACPATEGEPATPMAQKKKILDKWAVTLQSNRLKYVYFCHFNLHGIIHISHSLNMP